METMSNIATKVKCVCVDMGCHGYTSSVGGQV